MIAAAAIVATTVVMVTTGIWTARESKTAWEFVRWVYWSSLCWVVLFAFGAGAGKGAEQTLFLPRLPLATWLT